MVSVILPSYNVKPYIGKCLKSVINQKNVDIEIICVDANSTDGTLEVLMEGMNRDPRIKILLSEKRSYGYQMNLGIKAAKGDYIGIVETDDFIEYDMFSSLYECALENNVDFVKSGFYRYLCGQNRELNAKVPILLPQNKYGKIIDFQSEEEYRICDSNHIWSGIYRKDFLIDNNIWFNESQGASYQDASFSVLVNMNAKNAIYLDKAWYHYRTNNPESSVKDSKKWHCIIDEYRYVQAYFMKYHLLKTSYNHYIDVFKIHSYYWNAMRLDEPERKEFILAISEEVKKIINNSAEMNSLPDDTKKCLLCLADYNMLYLEEKRVNNDFLKIRKIIETAKRDGPYICVGAGTYFRALLDIQEATKTHIIKAVCDNNCNIVNTNIYEYLIENVCELAEKYKCEKWLVVSKQFSEEIKKQIINLGVKTDNIETIEYVPKWYEL